jgi:hypothetical protein
MTHLVKNHTSAINAGIERPINGYNINPSCNSNRGPQNRVAINPIDPVPTAARLTTSGTPQQTPFHTTHHIHPLSPCEPKTTTANTSYDRTLHHSVAEYAPNIMNVPCTAHRQLVSDDAATTAEEQSVSLAGRNKVKRLREQRKPRDMARDVFCMFPLHFVGKRRWAEIKVRMRRKEMKPRMSIAV